MSRILLLLLLMVALSACGTTQKVVSLNPATGYFPTEHKAVVVLDKPIDLDARKSLIVVARSEFVQGQIRNIGYFDEAITLDDLQTRIVQAGLSEQVPSIVDRIGLNRAAKVYKPFLWLRHETRGTGTQQYAKIILTDATTLEDVFVAETHLDYVWSGVNDQYNWYPMFNALIDYIEKHSETYRR